MPPAPEADPREILRWVRRAEVVGGITALAFGLALWSEGWWRWVLVASGVVGLSPWPGAQSILRKAERKPEVLVSDPERRRARGRRAAIVQVPLFTLVAAVVGYVLDGWGAAIFIGIMMGAGAGLGAWLFLRR